MTRLDLAKERLDIFQLSAKLGWDWVPSKSCVVPYRQDRNRSGSVFADGKLFKDFASGEPALDAPALLGRMHNLSPADAAREFIALAGVGNREVSLASPPRRPIEQKVMAPRERPRMPDLRPPSRADLDRLAELRGLGAAGLYRAARGGFLHIAKWVGHECWVVTDAMRWVCQFRRMDGGLFQRGTEGGEFKAWTHGKGNAAWPVGIVEAGNQPNVVIVEGGADLLAAWHFIEVEATFTSCAAVGIFGASQRIPTDALPLFTGKRVRIFAHADEPREDGTRPGWEAAARWEQQLAKAGAIVTTFDLSGLRQSDGKPVKDLNDVARMSAHDFADEPELSVLTTF